LRKLILIFCFCVQKKNKKSKSALSAPSFSGEKRSPKFPVPIESAHLADERRHPCTASKNQDDLLKKCL
jgi:hypothetical protein